MPIALTDIEARVLGSLIEKSLTTPEQYPLTLNSLMNACNQKSSRDPVMQLDEATTARALATLREKHLVYQKSESGNRAPKFGHHAENLLNGGTAKEIGTVCVLLLRGPQTPGEIKTRTDRLCEFESVADVVTVLDDLAQRSDGPYVARLARRPGQKEARYAQLFTARAENASTSTNTPLAQAPSPSPVREAPPAAKGVSVETRVAGLEARVKALEEELAELRRSSAPAPR